MMKAIAIDDEPIALEVVNAHASKVPFIDLKAIFTDAFQALDYLQKEPIDLLFLDIKMPDISGIDFAKSLNQKLLLIFTTAYADHALIGYELDAVDYLLKPFSFARFLKGCNKAYELFTSRNTDLPLSYLYVKVGYEQVKIMIDDILYLEATGNYVNFALKDNYVRSRNTFTEAIRLLPADQFVRVHRSYIVAINKIDKYERHQLTLSNRKVPISEAYRLNLVALLNNR